MARYLVIDLPDKFKGEADRLSKGDSDAIDKVLHLERELDEKNDEMNDLITKERQSNDELQRARRVLIEGLNDVLRANHDTIGIKNVGEIDSKVFLIEMKKRFFSLEYAERKGVKLCSLWQEKITNPQWHPYQIIDDDKGKPKRLLKEDDESLQDLKKEWGQNIYDAVVEALNEVHEYNPSGCYVVPELWNFKENRKAMLDEVISYILEAFKADVFKMGSTTQIKRSKTKGSCSETQEKALKNLLKEKEDLERSYQNLLAREQKCNAELQGVRKELIKGLNDSQSGNKSGIGIKQMGEIDVELIKRVCSKRFRDSEAEIGAEALCSAWQKKLENPQWHPFRMAEDDEGNLKRVVSEEDESLRSLKQTWGDEVYSEVVTALKDLYEYNPSRSHTVAEMWNFRENRKAELEEVISYVFFTQRIRQSKRKRTSSRDATILP